MVLRASGKQSEAFLTKVEGLLERLWLHDPSAGLSDRMAFELAVVEAVSNSIRHAVPAPGTHVALEVELYPAYRTIEAQVREVGAEPAILPDPSSMPAGSAEAGRGLAMLGQLMTTVTCERADGANLWTLVRERTDI